MIVKYLLCSHECNGHEGSQLSLFLLPIKDLKVRENLRHSRAAAGSKLYYTR